ncbi:hypothetical protein FISHEDRAFT_70019 [Fistulina hepatica ATCC 64428]|uniref:Uncharacterized protein n=1 Tax=Fistulina hepatica ATCC 64428 TaxID=1128425 RepID=A0A0D7AKR5_9AGAR|nr:hypothetical protein FISHEDRAFT_70019 [Fistulina hepatica ATCC 64428]
MKALFSSARRRDADHTDDFIDFGGSSSRGRTLMKASPFNRKRATQLLISTESPQSPTTAKPSEKTPRQAISSVHQQRAALSTNPSSISSKSIFARSSPNLMTFPPPVRPPRPTEPLYPHSVATDIPHSAPLDSQFFTSQSDSARGPFPLSQTAAASRTNRFSVQSTSALSYTSEPRRGTLHYAASKEQLGSSSPLNPSRSLDAQSRKASAPALIQSRHAYDSASSAVPAQHTPNSSMSSTSSSDLLDCSDILTQFSSSTSPLTPLIESPVGPPMGEIKTGFVSNSSVSASPSVKELAMRRKKIPTPLILPGASVLSSDSTWCSPSPTTPPSTSTPGPPTGSSRDSYGSLLSSYRHTSHHADTPRGDMDVGVAVPASSGCLTARSLKRASKSTCDLSSTAAAAADAPFLTPPASPDLADFPLPPTDLFPRSLNRHRAPSLLQRALPPSESHQKIHSTLPCRVLPPRQPNLPPSSHCREAQGRFPPPVAPLPPPPHHSPPVHNSGSLSTQEQQQKSRKTIATKVSAWTELDLPAAPGPAPIRLRAAVRSSVQVRPSVAPAAQRRSASLSDTSASSLSQLDEDACDVDDVSDEAHDRFESAGAVAYETRSASETPYKNGDPYPSHVYDSIAEWRGTKEPVQWGYAV